MNRPSEPHPSAPVRGRFAPSPSGELHLGNASSALLAWLSVRARGGSLVMRVEDLDPARSRPELIDRNLADLRWLGLDWDEGPDVGGPHTPYVQSERTERYRAAYRALAAAGRLYPCFCSRKEIAAAAHAPQEPGEQRRYPGTCRGLGRAARAARLEAGARHAWRVRVDERGGWGFDDIVRGRCGDAEGQRPDDFVVWRSDGVPAYQLAVVVDDAAMQVDEVVRGVDLLGSTPRQLVLYDALDLAPPRFAHVPLLLGADGRRLSKRHAGVTLAELRAAGVGAEQIVGALSALLGLRATSAPLTAAALVDGFELARLAARPDGLVVDLASI